MSRVATTPLQWRRASPGSKSLEKRSDAEFPAPMVARGGLVSTRFQGAVTLRAFDLSNGYRIPGKGGAGGVVAARVRIADAEGGATA